MFINLFFSFFYFIIFTFTYMCIHGWGHFPNPPLHAPPPSSKNLFCPFAFWFCWRENIRTNNDIRFVLVWSKDSYTKRFLVLLPCICVLQPIHIWVAIHNPEMVHFCKTSSLLPALLPIVASDSLRLLYSLFYSNHINHIQILGFLPFPIPLMCILTLVCDPCPIILLHLF
jgi:hypothetical protein